MLCMFVCMCVVDMDGTYRCFSSLSMRLPMRRDMPCLAYSSGMMCGLVCTPPHYVLARHWDNLHAMLHECAANKCIVQSKHDI